MAPVFTLADFLAGRPAPGRIVGVGIDLADVAQVAQVATGRGFLRQVFAEEERAAWGDAGLDAPALARAFALKEALFKALGTGQRLEMLFHEILCPPFAPAASLTLRGRTREVAAALGVGDILADVSLTAGAALGVVVLVAGEGA